MNYPHIIFLNLDGVLYPEKIIFLNENQKETPIYEELNLNKMIKYWKMDAVLVGMLNDLYNLRKYEFVLTSTWAKYHTKETIEKLFIYNNLEPIIHKDWKIDFNDKNKIENINEWLVNHKIADYLILDSTLESDLKENINITIIDNEDGVKMMDYYKMKAKILNWK